MVLRDKPNTVLVHHSRLTLHLMMLESVHYDQPCPYEYRNNLKKKKQRTKLLLVLIENDVDVLCRRTKDKYMMERREKKTRGESFSIQGF